MKIRIGNDVQLNIQLALGETEDRANIKSLRAIFVNTTLKDKLEAEYKKHNRFIGRFPIEPFVNEFEPNEYCINSTGYSRYNVAVYNQYRGFGLKPDWKNCFPIKQMPITEYYAEISHTQNPNTVSVLFPGEAQLYEGNYELIVIAKIYQPGYKNNTRTVSTNYKNIFELVKDSQQDGVDNPVRIELTNVDSQDVVGDVYVVSGSFSNNAIKLKRNDLGVVNIDVEPIMAGWYEDDWYEDSQNNTG